MTVLIVDSDPGRHTVISDILTQRGCRLLEVDGGREALRMAHAEKPAIAIVDLQLDRERESRLLERTGDANASRLLVSA